LKIVLVNLNYRIAVHMNVAQSRIPALVCSPQAEYGCHKARSQEGQRGNATLNSKVCRLIKYLKYKPKEILQCKSTKLTQGTHPTSAVSRIETCISPFVIISDRR